MPTLTTGGSSSSGILRNWRGEPVNENTGQGDANMQQRDDDEDGKKANLSEQSIIPAPTNHSYDTYHDESMDIDAISSVHESWRSAMKLAGQSEGHIKRMFCDDGRMHRNITGWIMQVQGK